MSQVPGFERLGDFYFKYMEIWKPIPIDKLVKYEVSDEGNVRHIKRKKIIKFGNIRGYLNFRYKPGKSSCKSLGGNYMVHRLVALAFIPNPQNFPMVNHLNGDRGDNRLENLEWTTASGNVRHGIKRRKELKKSIIDDLYNSKEWDSAQDFYNEVIKLHL